MLEKITFKELILHGADEYLIEDIIKKKILYYKTDSIEELNESINYLKEESYFNDAKLLVSILGKKDKLSVLPYFLTTPTNSILEKIDEKEIYTQKIEPLKLYDLYENSLNIDIQSQENKELLYALYLAELNNNEKIMLKYATLFFPDQIENKKIKLISTGPININNRGFIPIHYFSKNFKWNIEEYIK